MASGTPTENILASRLGRMAVATSVATRDGQPCAANLLRDCVEEIDKLAQHCQLTEFTEHGLPHVLSLVQRINSWTRRDGTPLLDDLSTDEAFMLMFAVVSHDIGMLTQRELDLPETDRIRFEATFADLPAWVRLTHVYRIERILYRLFKDQYPEFVTSGVFELICALARSHQSWPEEAEYDRLKELASYVPGLKPKRLVALAGILAVADLLDEDSSRCDTMTLFANKAGNLMNRAHWLRHILTADKLQVSRGAVHVSLRVPRNLQGRIDNALVGLRNHLELSRRYNGVLRVLRASIRIKFNKNCKAYDPVPQDEPALAQLLCQPDVHLLRTLEDDALPRASPLTPAGTLVSVKGVKLRTIDRTVLDHALGPSGTLTEVTDYEITYRAASLGPVADRILAATILGDAAWEAHSRGELRLVHRLAAAVMGDLRQPEDEPHNHTTLPIDHGLWAAAMVFHWARGQVDLLKVRWIFVPDVSIRDVDLRSKLPRLPLLGQVLALAILIFNREIAPPWDLLLELMEARTQDQTQLLSREEILVWHDLVEALWGLGYLAHNHSENFWHLFHRICEMEAADTDTPRRVLSQLSWRMAVQSHCLKGYGRWEAPSRSLEREHYGLPKDKGEQALADVWQLWFHQPGSPELGAAAQQVTMYNPAGSKLHAAALEARWHVHTSPDSDWSGEIVPYDYEPTETLNKDPAFQIIAGAITGVLSGQLEPKQDGVIHLGSRGLERHAPMTMIGERVALRRWYLGTWHKVVGSHLQATLSAAYTMSLEGDEVTQTVIDGIIDLPWADRYGGKALDLISALFTRMETDISSEDVSTIFQTVAASPQRISNLGHPCLKLLSDALPVAALPVLAEWTNRTLNNNVPWEACRVWNSLLTHVTVPPEIWRELRRLVHRAIRFLDRSSEMRKLVAATLSRSPWEHARLHLRDIVMVMAGAQITGDWRENAKLAAIGGLLNRTDEAWRDTPELRDLIAGLRSGDSNPDVAESEENALLIEFVEALPGAVHPGLVRHLVGRLHLIHDRALSRKSGEPYPLGTVGYLTGNLPPIEDTIAKEAARLLEELWTAERATWQELSDAVDIAGQLFRHAGGLGLEELARVFCAVMSDQRMAYYPGRLFDCSPSAWVAIANSSAYFPPSMMAKVQRLVQMRLMDLPSDSAWAASRVTVEALIRDAKPETHAALQMLLLALRARLAQYPNDSASAFVAAAIRLHDQPELPPQASAIVPMLIEWCAEAVSAPKPEVRQSVATACFRLGKIATGDLAMKVEQLLGRLRTDKRLRVRQAASGDTP